MRKKKRKYFTRQCCKHTWSLDSWAMRIASCRARSACWLRERKGKTGIQAMLYTDALYVGTCPSTQTPPVLVLTSGRSGSAGLPGWEQRSGDFGRSPRPRCSFPHFQTRWGGQNNVRDCGRRGKCPGLSCCSGSLGNAEERVKITELIKKISPTLDSPLVDLLIQWGKLSGRTSPLQQSLG